MSSRWSAGAYWAAAADPDPSDSVWEDDADWPLTYDDQVAPELACYIGGWPVTAQLRSASWKLGQGDVWSVLAVGSATLVLTPVYDDPDAAIAELVLADPAPTAGDRVVLLTAVDVLWVGTVDGAELRRTASGDGDPTVDAVLTIQASDDLAIAAAAQWEGMLGGQLAGCILSLMARAGVAVPNVQPSTVSPSPYLKVAPVVRSGRVLELLGSMLAAFGLAAAWSPDGLHVRSRDVSDAGISGSDQDDALTASSSYGTTVSRQQIRNAWAFPDMDALLASGTFALDYASSIQRYGRRDQTLTVVDWVLGTVAQDVYADILVPITATWSEPVELLSATYRILDGVDVAHRTRPLDDLGEGALAWIATTIAHDVAAGGSWTVTIDGVRGGL